MNISYRRISNILIGTSPHYSVHEACGKSPKRLGVSTIDLYFQHCVDTSNPIKVTVEAMAELLSTLVKFGTWGFKNARLLLSDALMPFTPLLPSRWNIRRSLST